jgi:DNA modification methylase
MTQFELVYTPIRKLRINPRNARTHSKKQIDQVASSIKEFGFLNPILVDEGHNIIAGHARFEAAKRLRLTQVPVISVPGLSDVQKRALALADNKIALNSGWDAQILATELEELSVLLPESGLSLEITGFEAAEIDNLMVDLRDGEAEPAEDIPPPEPAACVTPGDLWLLGSHRLLCGDARDARAFDLVMDGHRAAMVFTDPPYNLPVKSFQGRGRIKHREFSVASGEMDCEAFVNFLTTTLSQCAAASTDGSIHFVCMDWRHIGELEAAGGKVYSEMKNLVVWTKTNPGQGSFYRSAHELIFVFKHGEGAHQNNINLGRHGRSRSNVWSYAGANTFRAGQMDDLAMHPTVKPIALIADAMRDCSTRGDIVLDPFMGSGSTIMAAEKIGRRAFGIEVDPRYVEVALKRWQAHTRKDAILSSTGQTFDEVLTSGPTSKAVRRRR